METYEEHMNAIKEKEKRKGKQTTLNFEVEDDTTTNS